MCTYQAVQLGPVWWFDHRPVGERRGTTKPLVEQRIDDVPFDDDSGLGIGVARYVRTSAAGAEPAIVVVDEWQRRGVGSALIAALVQRARNEGIVRFDAPVLASNSAAIRLFERIGPTNKSKDGPQVTLTIQLRDDPPGETSAEPSAGAPA